MDIGPWEVGYKFSALTKRHGDYRFIVSTDHVFGYGYYTVVLKWISLKAKMEFVEGRFLDSIAGGCLWCLENFKPEDKE